MSPCHQNNGWVCRPCVCVSHLYVTEEADHADDFGSAAPAADHHAETESRRTARCCSTFYIEVFNFFFFNNL